MSKFRILVVEDEPDISEFLTAYLTEDGYDVTVAEDGMAAIDIFRSSKFDLVLLDILLPKIDGYGVLELIRRESECPVIMLTALDSEVNQIKGYELKADDYVTKPFSIPVLLHKISAVLRRSSASSAAMPEGDGKILERDGLRLDRNSRECTYNGQAIDLTQKEFDLLFELLNRPGYVFTREALLENIWGYEFYGNDRAVDSHIKNLRRKLPVDCIDTIRGVGYRGKK